jgi:lysophospholipase L1-like esterase
MMMNDVLWVNVERDEIARALFDDAGSWGDFYRWPQPDARRFAIGFNQALNSDKNDPSSCIAVINDDTAADILSWIRAFSPQLSPLSQFVRVVPMSDWERLSRREIGPEFPKNQQPERWASVILGEALAQSESDTNIGALPLSVAGSCFSTTIARTNLLHGTHEAIFMCTNRLEQLEHSRLFQRRPISVAQLMPAWDAMNGALDSEFTAQDAAILVAEIAHQYALESNIKPSLISTSLRDFAGLLSDSIEERVVTFQLVVKTLSKITSGKESNCYADAQIAAAAFLVGRGTAHSFLLRRFASEFSAAHIWFGVIAGLAGPSSWDENWFRASKGIERQLKAAFSWKDIPSSDLSWIEYSWMSNNLDDSAFSSLPRLNQRGLSVEIMPGAQCQLRFNDTRSNDSEYSAIRKAEQKAINKELEITLYGLSEMATRARDLVERSTYLNAHAPESSSSRESLKQPEFKLDGDGKSQSKAPRVIRHTKKIS